MHKHVALTQDQQETLETIKDFLKIDNEEPVIVIKGSGGTGKCLAVDTSIIMYDGTVKKVQNIIEGDVVMGDDSTPRTVQNVTLGNGSLYRVTSDNGDSYTVNDHHVLTLHGRKYIKWSGYEGYYVSWGDKSGFPKCKNFTNEDEALEFYNSIPELVDIDILTCIEAQSTWKSCKDAPESLWYSSQPLEWCDFFRGVRTSINFDHKDVKYDPYLFGLWLSTGPSSAPMIITKHPDILKYLLTIENIDDISIQEYDLDEYDLSVEACLNRLNLDEETIYPFTSFLKELSLFGNKHIPYCYKINSYRNRLSLLTGIIHGSGVRYNDEYVVCIKEEQLAEDIKFVARSLGFNCTYKLIDGKYCVFISSSIYDRLHIIPTKVNVEMLNDIYSSYESKRFFETSIIRIELQTVNGNYYGFELDGNHRFVLEDFTVTHNSFLTKHIVDYATHDLDMNVLAIAPTHKARRVLDKMLNRDRMFAIKTMTVSSVLGKIREHSYIGTKKYSRGSTQKMESYDLIILDEVSMVEDRDLDTYLDYICEKEKKTILIGDDCQLPCPSQKLVEKSNSCYKPNSSAFLIVPMCHLKTIVRQAADSPIIKLATYLRDNMDRENTLIDLLTGSGIEDMLLVPRKQLYDRVIKDLKQGLDTRILSYTNATTREHNKMIRKKLGYDIPYVEGDIITGYNAVGWPIPVIENGADYRITITRWTETWKIMKYNNLCGYVNTLQDIDNPVKISRELFFIVASHPNNAEFMKELIARAEKVNKPRSTREDFRNYSKLKNLSIFLEDIYKYGEEILAETEFRQKHPLLYTKLNEVMDINRGEVIESKLSKSIEDIYGNDILVQRIFDNKPYSENETLADKYMVVERDAYYGYALTTHKCVTPDTLIACKDGLKSIQSISKSLTESKHLSNTSVSIQYPIMGMSHIQQATQIYRGMTEATLRITTELGYVLEGSMRHPVMTYSKPCNQAWTKLPELKIGDMLMLRCGTECYGDVVSINLQNRETFFLPTEVDVDLSFMLGMITVNSEIDTSTGKVSYKPRSKQDRDLYLFYMRKLFTYDIPTGNAKYTNVSIIEIASKDICDFILYCGITSIVTTRKMPWSILSSPRECHIAYIKGLISACGLDFDRKNMEYYIDIPESLSKSVKVMLLNMGVITRSTNTKERDTNTCRLFFCNTRNAQKVFILIGIPLTYISNRYVASHIGQLPDSKDILQQIRYDMTRLDQTSLTDRERTFIHNLDVIDYETSTLFHKNCKPFSEYGNTISQWGSKGIFFDRIASIEEGVSELYDLYIPGDHTFIGNGVVNHNSQGSTYDNVYVDQNDFEKLTNKWNYAYGKKENRYREKNQLMYVAYTRASKQLGIVQ